MRSGFAALFLFTAIFAEFEQRVLTIVNTKGRLNERSRGILQRQLSGVEIRTLSEKHHYQKFPHLVMAACSEGTYYLTNASGALLALGCWRDDSPTDALREIRAGMEAGIPANTGEYWLNQALGSAAMGHTAQALAILDREEIKKLPREQIQIAERLKIRLTQPNNR